MLKKLLAILLLTNVALAQSSSPLRVNGKNLSITAEAGGSINFGVDSTTLFTASGTLASVGSVAAGLTATGTLQADALALAANHNVFTTVAAGTGALLPTCGAGSQLSVSVYNRGASPLAVYPQVGGTIAGLSANASVLVRPEQSAHFRCGSSADTWTTDIAEASLTDIQTVNAANTTPVAMTAQNAIATAAPTAGTGVITLPTCKAGLFRRVFNRIGTGAAITIKPPSGGQIDAAGTDTAVTLANGKAVIYFCATATQIYSLVGA